MTKAIFCGTFDPVTLGHLDVIKRASQCFDSLVVFVTPNTEKKTYFSAERRCQWLKESCKDLENVDCQIQEGLTVDAAHKVGAKYLVRGVRNGIDFQYEQNMDYMNQKIDPELDTICFFTKAEYMYYSSSNVKEMMKYQLDFSSMVPQCVWEEWKESE